MSRIPFFSVTNLACSRNGQILFENLSFSLSAGEALIVQGGNGTGKTSLLRCLAGIPETLPSITKKNFTTYTYIGHSNALKLSLTIAQNLEIQTLHSPQSLKLNLDWPDVVSRLDYKAESLSAGQQRQVALAKLTLLKAPLWIVDEPTANLDRPATHRFWTQTDMHLANGGMAIISTHEALPFANAKVLTLYG